MGRVEAAIRRRDWRVEYRRHLRPRIFASASIDSQLIGLGMARESIEMAIADAYRSALETLKGIAD